jgi:hypothetical protein
LELNLDDLKIGKGDFAAALQKVLKLKIIFDSSQFHRHESIPF